MSHDLSVLGDWFRANQLLLNPSKSVVMYFNSKKTLPDVMLDGIVIPRVNTHKFLGTWIDDDLAWNTQVQFVVSKLRSNCQLLSLAKNMLPVEVIRTVYFSHIHSHLNYNLSVWQSMLSKSRFGHLSVTAKVYTTHDKKEQHTCRCYIQEIEVIEILGYDKN